MKEPKSTVRYLGFKALLDGSRLFEFSFSRGDLSAQLVSVETPSNLFTGPDHMAVQECAGICYETLKCVVGSRENVPDSIKLTSADIAKHRKPTKTVGRRVIQ